MRQRARGAADCVAGVRSLHLRVAARTDRPAGARRSL